MKTIIEAADLHSLCNKERLFTSGSPKQYKKMFEIASNGVTRMELTQILYLCSNYQRADIYYMLEPLFNRS